MTDYLNRWMFLTCLLLLKYNHILKTLLQIGGTRQESSYLKNNLLNIGVRQVDTAIAFVSEALNKSLRHKNIFSRLTEESLNTMLTEYKLYILVELSYY